MGEVVAGFLVIGAMVGLAALHGSIRLRAWRNAAESCGLKVVDSSLFAGLTARGGRLEVQVKDVGEKNKKARIHVSFHGPLGFQNVAIHPQASVQLGREIEVGDPPFDNAFCIGGPAQLVLALLGTEMRRLLLDVSSQCKLEISRSMLRTEMSPGKVPKILPLLVEIGNQLAEPLDVPSRLAENAQRDTSDGVRLQNLRVLLRELPNHPRTAEALHAAITDPSPEARLRAAKELGDAGRDVLLELAEGMEDDNVSAEAVALLDRKLTFERTRAILGQALISHHTRTARACLEAFGRSGGTAAIDVLQEVMAQEEGELAAAAAQILGAIGNPAAEPSLILALQREQADLRVAAADALGRVGSVEAVLPLKEATESSWLDLELRRATRQAIAEIQSRLQGASPGQLSLAGTEAGQLSLATDSAGQVSLATAEPGQLSFSGEEEG
jgi:HEAT repeat protein